MFFDDGPIRNAIVRVPVGSLTPAPVGASVNPGGGTRCRPVPGTSIEFGAGVPFARARASSAISMQSDTNPVRRQLGFMEKSCPLGRESRSVTDHDSL